jgi:hypothetical protein
MFGFDPGIVALLIPIIAVLGGLALAIVSVIMKGKEEELKHKERIIAMEKGMAVPEMPKEERRTSTSRYRTWGLVMTLLGLALIAQKLVSGNSSAMTGGIIVAAIGIGFLLAAWFEKRDMEKK